MDELRDFGEFVDSHQRALLRAAWLLTGNWASAEDLVQTALAAAWQRWPRACRDGAPEGYVRAIMTTTFLGWRRRRWNDEQPTAELPHRPTSDDYRQVDDRDAVRDALAVLSRQQRAVIVLRYFADLSEAQTAAEMGCSVGAVKSHASRALARLREQSTAASILHGGVAP